MKGREERVIVRGRCKVKEYFDGKIEPFPNSTGKDPIRISCTNKQEMR